MKIQEESASQLLLQAFPKSNKNIFAPLEISDGAQLVEKVVFDKLADCREMYKMTFSLSRRCKLTKDRYNKS